MIRERQNPASYYLGLTPAEQTYCAHMLCGAQTINELAALTGYHRSGIAASLCELVNANILDCKQVKGIKYYSVKDPRVECFINPDSEGLAA